MGLLICRAIRDGLRIEDHDVGELARDEPAPVSDPQRVGRQRRQLPDRLQERDGVLVLRNTPSAAIEDASDP